VWSVPLLGYCVSETAIDLLSPWKYRGETVEQSEHPQREPNLVTRSSLQKQESPDPPADDKDRLAVLAFIEYLQAFREDIGKELSVPFGNGVEYYVGPSDLSSAIIHLAELVTESLRKKTLARFGRRLMGSTRLNYLLLSASSYLGFRNIVITGDPRGFSIGSLLATRPSGLPAPLTEEEEQELTDKTVAAMVKIVQAPNSEAFKQDATAIVADEKVRLMLFLEALQGTLRFLDRLSRQPGYQEIQLPFTLEDDRSSLALRLMDLLTSLLEGNGLRQKEQEQTYEPESNIVESAGSQTETVTLQVRHVEHTDNTHTYHLTLADSEYLREPVPFLLRVTEQGSAELFEDDNE
jgi:hypothetical protein